MFRRSAMVLAIIGISCFAGAAAAMPMECTSFAVQNWLVNNFIPIPAECFNVGWDTSIDVNFDNNLPDAGDIDKDGDVDKADFCKATKNKCKANPADVVGCLLARDECNYNVCEKVWRPQCDSTNNCINAYTYCGYLSDDCNEAVWGCAFGDVTKCQFVYSTCRLRSCGEIWKPFCDETNNCYISYKYCNHYLSDYCETAEEICIFDGGPKTGGWCDILYNTCGYPVPR